MNPLFRIDFSISDSLKIVRKSVLIYETIIIDRFPGKRGSDRPKDQLLRLHCHLYLLISPPLFETILSNAEMNLKVRMITYLLSKSHIHIEY